MMKAISNRGDLPLSYACSESDHSREENKS